MSNITLNANAGWSVRDFELTPGDLDGDAEYVFTHGHCHSLALAIHEATGWPLYGTRWDYGPGVPGHIVVEAPNGGFFDIEGWNAPPDPRPIEPELLYAAVPNEYGEREYRWPEVDKARHWVEPVLASIGLTVPEQALTA